MMREAINKKLYTGFAVGRDKVDVSILQYADDTIFFGEASMENYHSNQSHFKDI